MDTEHLGIFAIPPPHHKEILEADRRWVASLRAHQDDTWVLENAMYRRAAEVAVYSRVLDGQAVQSAVPVWARFLRKHIWKTDDDPSVFTADEAPALLAAIEDYERRAGPELVLLRRTARKELTPFEDVRAVYEAFADVLRAAVARGAGLAYASCDDEAEDRLARQRAEFEREWREAEERARLRPPRTPEEQAAAAAATQAELDRLVEERNAALAPKHEPVPVWLGTVEDQPGPRSPAVNLRRRLQRAFALAASAPDDREVQLQAGKRIYQARGAETLFMDNPRRRGGGEALRALAPELAAANPGLWRPEGVYRARDVPALRRAVHAWKAARGGMGPAVKHLAAEAQTTRRLAAGALRLLEEQLAWAIEAGRAFVWIDDRTGWLEWMWAGCPPITGAE